MNTDPFQNAFPGSLPLRIHHRLRGHFTMEQADDLAGVILEALSQNVATKEDIGKVRDDIGKNTTDIHAEIKRVEAQINADMTVKLKDLELRMTEKMSDMEVRLTEKMSDMEVRLTEKMGKLIFGSTAFTVTVLGALMTLAKFI